MRWLVLFDVVRRERVLWQLGISSDDGDARVGS